MDALEELKKALERYDDDEEEIMLPEPPDYGTVLQEAQQSRFVETALNYLPTLIAELEARRAQAGDIPNAAGFTPSATREMK